MCDGGLNIKYTRRNDDYYDTMVEIVEIIKEIPLIERPPWVIDHEARQCTDTFLDTLIPEADDYNVDVEIVHVSNWSGQECDYLGAMIKMPLYMAKGMAKQILEKDKIDSSLRGAGIYF